MRALIFIFLFFLNQTEIFCQQDLVFEGRIIVKDTMGNTDTLWVGLAAGISEGLNPLYGELVDMSPLDTILDVRGGFFVNDPSRDSVVLTNKVISVVEEPALYNGQTCYRLAERMFLFIHARHQPVTIIWEKNEWADECTSASWITTEPLSETVTGWWNIQDERTYRCMAQDTQVVWSLPQNLPDGSSLWRSAGWYTVHSMADGSMDTIPCIQIVPKYRLFFDTPCRQTPVLDEHIENILVNVLPNPSSESIRFDTEKIISDAWVFAGGVWQLFSERKALQDEISISHLPSGFYPIKVMFEDGSHTITRFVKM